MSFIWTFKVLVVCGGGWLVCEGSLTPPTNTELSNNLFYLKDMNHFITSVSKIFKSLDSHTAPLALFHHQSFLPGEVLLFGNRSHFHSSLWKPHAVLIKLQIYNTEKHNVLHWITYILFYLSFLGVYVFIYQTHIWYLISSWSLLNIQISDVKCR